MLKRIDQLLCCLAAILLLGCETTDDGNLAHREGVFINSATLTPKFVAAVNFTVTNFGEVGICIGEPVVYSAATLAAELLIRDDREKIIKRKPVDLFLEESRESILISSQAIVSNELKFGGWMGQLKDYPVPFEGKLIIPAIDCPEGPAAFNYPEFYIESDWVKLEFISEVGAQ